MRITTVTTDDAEALTTTVATLAKAHWGYDESFMRAAKDELAVSAEKINADDLFYRCLRNSTDDILAFYCVDKAASAANENAVELDGLFTHPDWIGTGFGQQLFKHACELSLQLQADKLLIQSDPNAVGFYQKMGCKTIGERPSGSITGRMLPMMVKQLR